METDRQSVLGKGPVGVVSNGLMVRTRLRVDTDIVDIVLGKGVTFEDPPG